MIQKTLFSAALLLCLGVGLSANAQVSKADRPLINPIELPGYYLQAVENRTHTAEGRPGANYWQQF
jgi:hypothetical protein